MTLVLWRRGRGIQRWFFNYTSKLKGHPPGWYTIKRKFIYRLNIDNAFPNQLVWLGVLKKGKWVSTEALYEPLVVLKDDDAAVVSKRPLDRCRVIRRGKLRVRTSAAFMRV